MDQNDTVSAVPISCSLSCRFYISCWNLIAAVYKNIRLNFLPAEHDNGNTITPKGLRSISLNKIRCERCIITPTRMANLFVIFHRIPVRTLLFVLFLLLNPYTP